MDLNIVNLSFVFWAVYNVPYPPLVPHPLFLTPPSPPKSLELTHYVQFKIPDFFPDFPWFFFPDPRCFLLTNYNYI